MNYLNLGLWALGAYLALFLLWVLYLAAMNVKRNLANMHPVAKAHGYVLVAIAAAYDLAVNVVIGTVLFADPPRELMLTARLKRYRKTPGTWRAKLAAFVCDRLLDQFDPNGDHC